MVSKVQNKNIYNKNKYSINVGQIILLVMVKAFNLLQLININTNV